MHALDRYPVPHLKRAHLRRATPGSKKYRYDVHENKNTTGGTKAVVGGSSAELTFWKHPEHF